MKKKFAIILMIVGTLALAGCSSSAQIVATEAETTTEEETTTLNRGWGSVPDILYQRLAEIIPRPIDIVNIDEQGLIDEGYPIDVLFYKDFELYNVHWDQDTREIIRISKHVW